jgi:hypothetical protein
LQAQYAKASMLRLTTPDISMKIDPYYYPVIIIAAFAIGMLIALALGFRPEHGSTKEALELVPSNLDLANVIWRVKSL